MDDLRLVAMPSAMNCAALFVRFTLTEWSLKPLAEHAVQVVSRFVKAVVDAADPKRPAFMTLRLRVRGDCLMIELEDDQPGRPLVDLAGEHTGVVQLDGRGKLVWCELPLPSGVSADEVALPRRGARRSLVEEQLGNGPQAEVDPAVLRRILTGLTGSS
ncbi:hypothetical protein [Amycolatopsis nigrescens]|uniref:hypothetical protein n=1 Tax=Amycolatopsis nigrescens TaxID=381445 RepID=UPI00037A4052|nr:hypothetical protein [Amycolatopsis nigrescens]